MVMDIDDDDDDMTTMMQQRGRAASNVAAVSREGDDRESTRLSAPSLPTVISFVPVNRYAEQQQQQQQQPHDQITVTVRTNIERQREMIAAALPNLLHSNFAFSLQPPDQRPCALAAYVALLHHHRHHHRHHR